MTAPRPLADVEEIVARIGADEDLTPTQRLVAQRDAWREQAYESAVRMRAIQRTLRLMLGTYQAGSHAAHLLQHIIRDIVGPELLDQPTPVAQHSTTQAVATGGGAS